MGQAVRAIYEHGQLRLLDPVDLTEGQEIGLIIVIDEDNVDDVLGELLIPSNAKSDLTDADDAKLEAELDALTRGAPPVSDTIIKERNEGP